MASRTPERSWPPIFSPPWQVIWGMAGIPRTQMGWGDKKRCFICSEGNPQPARTASRAHSPPALSLPHISSSPLGHGLPRHSVFHSRFLARQFDSPSSRLCGAPPDDHTGLNVPLLVEWLTGRPVSHLLLLLSPPAPRLCSSFLAVCPNRWEGQGRVFALPG